MRAAPQNRKVTVMTAPSRSRRAVPAQDSPSSGIALVGCGTLVVERIERMPASGECLRSVLAETRRE